MKEDYSKTIDYFESSQVGEVNLENNFKNMNSNLWNLDWKDLANGIVMAVLGNVIFYLLTVFTNLYQLVMSNKPFEIEINLRAVLIVAVFSMLTYLSKRFVSGSNNTILSNK